MPSLVLKIVLLFVLCYLSICQACNKIDQDSLFFLTLDVSSPHPLNWSSALDCCLWEGITCDSAGRVTRLWLPWRGLEGKISPSINNLTHLHHLNLSHNRLSGTLLASSFSSLTLLETLDLSYNRLIGEFPSSLSPNYIKLVDLSSNQFQGMIPPTFFLLTRNLISFNVSNNSFTGLIPSSAWIQSFCSIRILDFSYNDFGDSISPGLGNCSKLQIFRAGFNNLLGPIPDDIYSATSIEVLSLPVNLLSGYISNEIIRLTNLTILELYSNQLTGAIPKDIGKLTNLKYLLLHINNLSGSLPPSMMNFTNLKTLNLRVNNFGGNLSAFNFSKLIQLNTLDLGNNNFSGSFPSTLASCGLLTAVRLASNQLEGQISSEIVALESLSFLSLSKNSFTNVSGAIRILMAMKNLTAVILSENFINEAVPNYDYSTFSVGFQNLQILGLGGCQLRGQVPLWLGKLTKLQVLDLSVNQIAGSIPGWLAYLPSLYYIDLSYNLIWGEFPKEFCRLPMLASKQPYDQLDGTYLELPVFVRPSNVSNMLYNQLSNLPPAIYLRNNGISGSIPFDIGQLKYLHVLDLSHNSLSGEIPESISQLANLEKLDLSRNSLSGEIPASFRGLHFLSSFSVADNNLEGPIPSGGQFDTFPASSFEGNPGLCGSIIKCTCIQPSTSCINPVVPSESSNEELGYGLIAGAVFGFVIGSTTGILYPLHRLKFLQLLRRKGLMKNVAAS